MYTAGVFSVSDEQRQYLDLDGVPLPLIDAEGGRAYMVMPVDISADEPGTFRATMPGIDAVAEVEIPSDAVETLAVLLRKMAGGSMTPYAG